MVIEYNEPEIEKNIPLPENAGRGAKGKGRNQRLAAKMGVGDSVLLPTRRANNVAQILKRNGFEVMVVSDGLHPNIEPYLNEVLEEHSRVFVTGKIQNRSSENV